jgi:DNA-binding Lrp family transcriptional regulator
LVKQLASYEDIALKLIKENGGYMLQKDLWKELKLDSREGSRLVARLVKKGLIKREEVTINGRKTFKLILARDSNSNTLSVRISLRSVLNIPCTTCPIIDKCGVGNFYEPSTCALMDSWVYKIASSRRGSLTLTS